MFLLNKSSRIHFKVNKQKYSEVLYKKFLGNIKQTKCGPYEVCIKRSA